MEFNLLSKLSHPNIIKVFELIDKDTAEPSII